jgi:hypothetical protein
VAIGCHRPQDRELVLFSSPAALTVQLHRGDDPTEALTVFYTPNVDAYSLLALLSLFRRWGSKYAVYSNFCQKPVQCNMPITYDYSLLWFGKKTRLFTHVSIPESIALVIGLPSWRFTDTYLANRCFEQGVETIFEHVFLPPYVPSSFAHLF